jgi:hypothetical protein
MSAVARAAPATVVATAPTVLRRPLRRLADGSHPPTPEGSQLGFPWGNVAVRLNPYPTHYRPAFACSLVLYPLPHRLASRFAFPSPLVYRAWRTTGLPRSADVPGWVGSRLYAGGSPSAPEEFGAPGPGHVPFWPKRFSSSSLFLCDGAWDALPGLTMPLDPGSRLPCCWQSQLRLAPGLPSRRRRLRCPGACYPGRIPLAEQRVLSAGPPTSAQLHRRPRVAPERPSSAAGAALAD